MTILCRRIIQQIINFMDKYSSSSCITGQSLPSQWHLRVHDLTSNRKWINSCISEIKIDHITKVNQQHRFFLKFFSQLILTAGSLNTGSDIAVYYGLWAGVSTKKPAALFSVVAHTSWISHLKAESISYLNHLTKKSL